MAMKQPVTATFDLVTPTFLGGATPAQVEGFRLASLKGALRFWWRAVRYAELVAELTGHAQPEVLSALQAEEGRLFGSSGDRQGQGCFLMRFAGAAPSLAIVDRASGGRANQLRDGADGPVAGPGALYLGYGLAKAGQLNRSYLREGQSVAVEFMFKPSAAGCDQDQVVRAIKVLGLLGGVGSRARRGYGSLSLVRLSTGDRSPWQAPTSIEGYRQAVAEILPNDDHRRRAGAIPPLSAFARDSRIEILGQGKTALAVLNQVGEAMVRYRSWGHRGQITVREPAGHETPIDSERNFEDDHDWSKAPGTYRQDGRLHVPRHSIFGLPHNYSKTLGVKPNGSDRRASPLLLHIHQLGDPPFLAVAVLLPAQFLPDSAKGQVQITGIGAAAERDYKPDWTVLTGFLDRNKYFPRKTIVLAPL